MSQPILSPLPHIRSFVGGCDAFHPPVRPRPPSPSAYVQVSNLGLVGNLVQKLKLSSGGRIDRGITEADLVQEVSACLGDEKGHVLCSITVLVSAFQSRSSSHPL